MIPQRPRLERLSLGFFRASQSRVLGSGKPAVTWRNPMSAAIERLVGRILSYLLISVGYVVLLFRLVLLESLSQGMANQRIQNTGIKISLRRRWASGLLNAGPERRV